MCRVTEAIETTKAKMEQVNLPPDKAEELRVSLNMKLDEYCHFHNLKSVLMGTNLTTDEAQIVYGFLGETVEHFNAQSLEVKIVLTTIHTELLNHVIKMKGN